jgi:hypothetical protein
VFYRPLQVDTTNSGAVAQAGGVLLTETTIATAGLGRAMSAALSSWRKPLAVHAQAQSSWIWRSPWPPLGGDCMANMTFYMTSRAGMDVSHLMRRLRATISALAADIPAVLAAISTARAAVRAVARKLAAVHTLDHDASGRGAGDRWPGYDTGGLVLGQGTR